MKKISKSKEQTNKGLNRHASQKIIIHTNEAEPQKKHQRNNSVSNNILSGKSKEKTQKLIKQYSTAGNRKILDKIPCKTQENSDSVETNGKSQRTLITANHINKANLSKIKLKLPSAKNSKDALTKNALVYSKESNQAALIESLKKEVLRLNLENKKLKDDLDEERSVNSKFKEFAQDLMKYYDKNENSSKKKHTKDT